MKTFAHLLATELALFARSRLGMFWTLAFPLLLLVVQMTLFGQGPSLGLLKVGLADLDGTAASRDLADFVSGAMSAQTALKAAVARVSAPPESSRYDVILVIPAGFAESRQAGRPGLVEIRQCAAGPAAAAGLAMLRGIADAYTLHASRLPRATLLRVLPSAVGPPGLSYSLYVVTGLLVMVIISTSLMGFAQPLVAAREGGLFRLYQVFPIAPAKILAAWLVARIVITILSSVVLLAVAVLLYRAPISFAPASLGFGAAALVLGCAAFLSVGLLIAAVSPSVPAVTMICNLAYFPLIFSGNLLLPTGRLPEFAQRLLGLLPVNALVASLRRSFSGQAQFAAEAGVFATLLLIAALGLAIASRHFSWTSRDHA